MIFILEIEYLTFTISAIKIREKSKVPINMGQREYEKLQL